MADEQTTMTDAAQVKTLLSTPRPKSARNGKKSLITKLTEVQASISGVAKTGFNDFHSYSYAEEAAIVAACRDELAKRGVMIIPSIQTVKQEGTLTTIETSYTFCDGTTGEQFVTTWAGTGSDKGDKGLYKAITGSQKYVLMKTFLIPTGENGVADDPEHPAREVRDAKPVLRAPVTQPPLSARNTLDPQVPANPGERRISPKQSARLFAICKSREQDPRAVLGYLHETYGCEHAGKCGFEDVARSDYDQIVTLVESGQQFATDEEEPPAPTDGDR